MRRRYFLGGSVAGGRWYAADSFVPLVIVLMVVVGLTVVAMSTMGPGGAGVVLAISAVMFFLATKKDSLGIAPIAGLQGQVTRWVLKRAGWNSFDPDTEDLPVALGRVRALAWSAAEGRPEVALLEHIDEGYISATILLHGEFYIVDVVTLNDGHCVWCSRGPRRDCVGLTGSIPAAQPDR